MTDKYTFPGQLSLYDLSELQTVSSMELRRSFTARGKDFHLLHEELVAKLPHEELIELVKTVMRSTVTSYADLDCPAAKVNIQTASLTEKVLEFTAYADDGRVPLVTADTTIVKTFLDLGQGSMHEDYYPDDEAGNDLDPKVSQIATFELLGSPDLVKLIFDNIKTELDKKHKEDKSALIKWVFVSESGSTSKRTFRIKKEWDIDEAYYPWLKGSLAEYYQAFLNSTAQILVMYGKPGGGKTSFIRDMICETDLNAFISYDLKMLTADSTFVNYLTDRFFDAIIIEDADELLTSARGEHNKVISKILNISDGLIKLPKKKLIFTTNLKNVSDIDAAIIRPGRCFDVLNFRELTVPEAEVVAGKLGVKLVDKKKTTYTLAELFGLKHEEDTHAHTHTIGQGIGFLSNV